MSDYGATPSSPEPDQPYGQPSPGAPYGRPAGGPPSYLAWAILSTILCCLPLGIVSIVFAAQVNSKWQAGDYAGAQAASARAKRFAIWSAVAGVVVIALYVVLVLTLTVAGEGTSP